MLASLRLVLCLFVAAMATTAVASEGLLAEPELKALVETLHPEQNPPITNAFTDPASDVAKAAQSSAITSFLVFVPFLVLPQILLIVVIMKFRDRKDGRKPATFTHNNTLEIVWTAIPFIVVVLISFPMAKAVYFADSPGDPQQRANAMVVQLIGKSFSWEWRYPGQEDLAVTTYGFINPHTEAIRTLDSGAVENKQAPVAFVKDQYTELWFKSADVNHAWYVPALGVKKDCFQDRWNFAWMTPTQARFLEGQCYELCGQGHGIMLFGAVVLEDKTGFDKWVSIQKHQFDAFKVVQASVSGRLGTIEQADVDAAVEAYLANGSGSDRILALQYWLAANDHIAVKRLEGLGENGRCRSY